MTLLQAAILVAWGFLAALVIVVTLLFVALSR